MNQKAVRFTYIAFIIPWLYSHLTLLVVISWLCNLHEDRGAEQKMVIPKQQQTAKTPAPEKAVTTSQIPVTQASEVNPDSANQLHEKPVSAELPVNKPSADVIPTNGMPRSEVIALFGEPKGSVAMEGAISLLYEAGSVTLINNRVTEVKWKTPEEIQQAQTLKTKQQNDVTNHQLPEKQARRFTTSIERDQTEYDRLEQKKISRQGELNSLKKEYDVQYEKMLKYKSLAEHTASVYEKKYAAAQDSISWLKNKMRQIRNELTTVQSRQRKLKNNINTNKAFLRRHNEQNK